MSEAKMEAKPAEVKPEAKHVIEAKPEVKHAEAKMEAKHAEKPEAKHAVEAKPEVKHAEAKHAVSEAKNIIEGKSSLSNIKLFGKWDSNVIIADPGLQRYITLRPMYVPKSQGRFEAKKFWKSKAHIVERLMNKIGVTAHKGKKHWKVSGINAGKYLLQYNTILKTFDIIEKKLKENPIQILVKAVENSSPCAEVIPIEYGGIKHPKSVDVAPQRRVDLSLRWLTQGSLQESVSKHKPYFEVLADNLIAAAQNDTKCYAVNKKQETERQAVASR
ncbi:30S ribosomal protein S7 [Candidatus Tiddalikarchaeum anstoanum]|nr:30S ribosomal protein S7 [Candidatus Tiddalikarchaeum anstoanum]